MKSFIKRTQLLQDPEGSNKLGLTPDFCERYEYDDPNAFLTGRENGVVTSKIRRFQEESKHNLAELNEELETDLHDSGEYIRDNLR